MKTVVTYGTFDLFHVGHIRLLKRLQALGDRLIVGCSTDEFNEKKGKRTVMPYEQREELLLGCRYVDDVFPEKCWEQKRSDITEYKVDIFAIGDDWSGHFDTLQDICEVMYLPRTRGISSTDVKKLVVSRFKNELVSITTELQNVEKRIHALTENE